MTGIASKGVGDSDTGVEGNGLLRCVLFSNDVGDNGSSDGAIVEFRSEGEEDKLSNETVGGIFDSTSFP